MASRREIYPENGTERSVALSPLLNLAPAAATGATMKQHVALVPLSGSGISGGAELILSPDRRTVDVRLRLDRPRAVTIALRRVEAEDGEELLIAEITAGGGSGHALCRGRRFALDGGLAQMLRILERAEREAGLCLAGLGADSIEGIAVAPAQRGGGRSYFAERMLSEIAAAEGSASAVAASRHVQLATLYARHLRPPA